MKTIMFVMFLSISNVSASELIGSWSTCEKVDEVSELEYTVDFKADGKEYEYQIYSKIGKTPCSGLPLFASATTWNYTQESNSFHSSLVKFIVATELPHIAKTFSTDKECGLINWKAGEIVDCTDKLFLDAPFKKGMRTAHTYSIKGNQLHVISENGETTILTKKEGEK